MKFFNTAGPVMEEDHYMLDPQRFGSERAPIHIVEISDLSCSACSTFQKEMAPFIDYWLAQGVISYSIVNIARDESTEMAYLIASGSTYTKNIQDYQAFRSYVFTNMATWHGKGVDGVNVCLKEMNPTRLNKKYSDAMIEKYTIDLRKGTKLLKKASFKTVPLFFINDVPMEKANAKTLIEKIQLSINKTLKENQT